MQHILNHWACTECMACMVFQLGSELITNILNVKLKKYPRKTQKNVTVLMLPFVKHNRNPFFWGSNSRLSSHKPWTKKAIALLLMSFLHIPLPEHTIILHRSGIIAIFETWFCFPGRRFEENPYCLIFLETMDTSHGVEFWTHNMNDIVVSKSRLCRPSR